MAPEIPKKNTVDYMGRKYRPLPDEPCAHGHVGQWRTYQGESGGWFCAECRARIQKAYRERKKQRLTSEEIEQRRAYQREYYQKRKAAREQGE